MIFHRILPAILLTIFLQSLHAQSGNPAQADTASLRVQFDQMLNASNRFQDFKVVRQSFLDAFMANVGDSVQVYTAEIAGLKTTISDQRTKIDEQATLIGERETEIAALKGEKDSMDLLGLDLPKATYNIVMWSVIGILLAALLFVIARARLAVSTGREARQLQEKTAEELERSRKSRLEVEQKLRRQLQDERNKRNGGTD